MSGDSRQAKHSPAQTHRTQRRTEKNLFEISILSSSPSYDLKFEIVPLLALKFEIVPLLDFEFEIVSVLNFKFEIVSDLNFKFEIVLGFPPCHLSASSRACGGVCLPVATRLTVRRLFSIADKNGRASAINRSPSVLRLARPIQASHGGG
jgi:hypothetical protein